MANKEVAKEGKSRVQLNVPHHSCNNAILELNECTLLIDIATEITKALHKTTRHVGWRVIVEMVAGGPGRVQPVNGTSIARFVIAPTVHNP